MLNKTKEVLLKKANVTQKVLCVPNQGNFNNTNRRVLEFVLEKCKNILPSPRDQYQQRHCKSLHPKISKPVMDGQ